MVANDAMFVMYRWSLIISKSPRLKKYKIQNPEHFHGIDTFWEDGHWNSPWRWFGKSRAPCKCSVKSVKLICDIVVLFYLHIAETFSQEQRALENVCLFNSLVLGVIMIASMKFKVLWMLLVWLLLISGIVWLLKTFGYGFRLPREYTLGPQSLWKFVN